MSLACCSWGRDPTHVMLHEFVHTIVMALCYWGRYPNHVILHVRNDQVGNACDADAKHSSTDQQCIGPHRLGIRERLTTRIVRPICPRTSVHTTP